MSTDSTQYNCPKIVRITDDDSTADHSKVSSDHSKMPSTLDEDRNHPMMQSNGLPGCCDSPCACCFISFAVISQCFIALFCCDCH
jgi:hypothetical protein